MSVSLVRRNLLIICNLFDHSLDLWFLSDFPSTLRRLEASRRIFGGDGYTPLASLYSQIRPPNILVVHPQLLPSVLVRTNRQTSRYEFEAISR